jgi:adenine-specific DNA-methyltransferase
MTTDPGDLVLDPTCGSGTTAYVAEQWGRRWITIDTSRVAIALARTRLMAAKYPYYLLADSPEGAKKEMEIGSRDFNRAFGTTEVVTTGDIKRGFVYKRVPHVTLKAIANNEELDALHARWQPQLDPLRAKINKLAKQTWEEWEIPRELPKDLTGLRDLSGLHAEWWQVRRERQSEIDASIAKRADTELLYDQPYEDNKRIRVTGPFTVESLSPHRVLSTDEADELPASEKAKDDSSRHYSFETMIVENLKKAGVQNTVKQERLKFDRLEPYAGVWVNAVGEYTEAPHPGPLPKGEGVVRRVAVSIGPEHGTVGPEQVQEAAKEAVQGIGFDLLIVCGFAFDPHVSLESMRYGKLQVLIARMNPDLSLGDEVLKKTGAGNLFMVFGEPDIEVKRSNDFSRSRYYVELKGVDVYDPTTGAIRSHTTDEIACWFIDTAYDGESFFVRQAYFTGAGDPYDRLKRALRAEIDEEAWAALYTTKSYPFDAPPGKKGKPGKIAVKVINHYGDEVLKVVEVG